MSWIQSLAKTVLGYKTHFDFFFKSKAQKTENLIYGVMSKPISCMPVFVLLETQQHLNLLSDLTFVLNKVMPHRQRKKKNQKNFLIKMFCCCTGTCSSVLLNALM